MKRTGAIISGSFFLFIALWVVLAIPTLENPYWILENTTQNIGKIQYRESLDEPLTEESRVIFNWYREIISENSQYYDVQTIYEAIDISTNESLWELVIDEKMNKDRSYYDKPGYLTWPNNMIKKDYTVYDLGGETLLYEFLGTEERNGLEVYTYEGGTTFDISEEYPEFAPYTVYEDYYSIDFVDPKTGIAVAYTEEFVDYVIIDGEKFPILIVSNEPNVFGEKKLIEEIKNFHNLLAIYHYGLPILVGIVSLSMFFVLNYKNREKEKSKELEIFSSILDKTSMIIKLDSEKRILFVNDNFKNGTGYSLNEIKNKSLSDLEFDDISPSSSENTDFWTQDIQFKMKDGNQLSSYSVITRIYENNSDFYLIYSLDVSEQKALETELKLINKTKSEFVALVAHELRTPLAVNIFLTKTLLDFSDLSDEIKSTVREIYSNQFTIDNLITDFFDMEKLELSQMQLKKNIFSTHELVSNLKKSLSTLFSTKNLFLISECNVDDAYGDFKRITQVLTNLVKNSIDFSPENSEIKITATKMSNHVKFSVEDQGSGIPIEKQDKVFSKFYQVDSSVTREHGGTGLGLAISKALVEKHGGKIWFESVEGKGTVFHFTLPDKNYSPEL